LRFIKKNCAEKDLSNEIYEENGQEKDLRNEIYDVFEI
jgi:hypothetical protein